MTKPYLKQQRYYIPTEANKTQLTQQSRKRLSLDYTDIASGCWHIGITHGTAVITSRRSCGRNGPENHLSSLYYINHKSCTTGNIQTQSVLSSNFSCKDDVTICSVSWWMKLFPATFTQFDSKKLIAVKTRETVDSDWQEWQTGLVQHNIDKSNN